MKSFYTCMLDHFEDMNAALFANGIEMRPIRPDLLTVVHVAYFDSSYGYIDEIETRRFCALLETRDVAHLGEAAGDLADTMRRILHNREIDVMWADDGKDRNVLSRVLACKTGVLVMCREGDRIDPRIFDACTLVLRPEVNASVLRRVCRHFWDDDYDRRDNHGADAYTLTDVLVAARGAVSSKSFFERLYGPRRSVEPAVEAPAKPARMKLSDMSGFGPARDWGLQLAEDVRAYRAGDISWSDVDSGLLLSSPPGGGKTLFASALAAELECEFIPTQYSEWEGSDSRITKGMEKLFSTVRKKAENDVVIFFIDEIDSLGARGDNQHNESWWTAVINTLLAFLDGAVDRRNVIVIAATNLPKRVDPALRRPGRLDKHVIIPPPNIGEIEGILLHHLKLTGSPYPKFLRQAAMALRGSSPADIMQVARDARRHARKDAREVRIYDVLDILPPPKLKGVDDWIVCVHEAGHVVGNLHGGFRIESVDADRTVTNSYLPPCVRSQPLKDMIRMTLAGRAAEEVIVGEIGVGCRIDLSQATRDLKAHLFQGGEAGLVSRDVGQLWPSDVALLEAGLRSLYKDAVSLVTRRRQHVVVIARALQKSRYLDGFEVDAILKTWRARFFVITETRFDAEDAYWAEQGMRDPRQMAA